MANDPQTYLQLADHTAHQITKSFQKWTGFLGTVGRLYKYPYSDQLMIYAQRPEATACAAYDLWNKQMQRYVLWGARGIALIDTSTGENKVRYVFDISDTREKENARRPFLWQYRPEHQTVVAAALEGRYGISGEDGLADQLEKIAGQIAMEYWNDNQYDLLHIVDGSFLEGYDEYNIQVAFCSAASVSITYALMSRCGLEPEGYFDHEDFQNIFDFNTREATAALGVAVSQGSEQVLRQIEVTIRKFEREKLAERSAEHGEQSDLHPGGGRTAAQPDPARTVQPELEQVRPAAPEVSEGAPPGAVGIHEGERDVVQPLAGGRGQGHRDAGAADALPGTDGRGYRGTEIQRPHDLGGPNELLQVPGGGDHLQRTDLQLNTQPAPEGPSVKTPGPSAISEAEPFSNAVMNDYNATKAAHPDDIVLFQMGDFFEMYGDDAEIAAPLLGLNLTTRPVPGAGRVKMCGIPAHALAQYAEKLRDKYDVTVSAMDATTNQRSIYTLRATGQEAEIGTDGTQDAASPPPQSAPDNEKLTELQEKALEIVKQYETLPIQDKINVIAQTFGYTTGAIETSPCTGKWRGTSDISIRFDNGVSLFLGNQSTPQAKTAKVQNEYVTAALTRYNPEIVSITKETALASLRKREIKDNEIAVQKGFKPYSLLNVEISDGAAPKSGGYIGRYYVTLAVDGKILTHLESGLAHDIASGKVSEVPTRENYFTAGGLKDADVDYIFNNVGFSSTVDMYSLPLSDAVRERAEKTLEMRESDDTAETPAPTIREQYDKYKPIVIAAVTEDTAYRNACGHSDRENAVIEGNAAVRRVVLHSGDMELLRLYSDVPVFRNQLHREVIDETYPQLHELLRPLSQDDIDEALQAWNGDLDSKRRVVRYMEAHGREKGTAEWLSREYGGAADKNLFVIRQGSPEMLELPWPKVQRRIAQLIKEDRFFTEQELDNFEDIDPAAIREQLESGEPSAFVEQVMGDVEQIAAEEQVENAPAEPPDLSGQPVTREGNPPQKVIGAADQPPHDPFAPAYNVGDTAYLNDTAFEIYVAQKKMQSYFGKRPKLAQIHEIALHNSTVTDHPLVNCLSQPIRL